MTANKPGAAGSLTMALDSFAKNSLIPGFSVVVANQHGRLYTKGFGYADLEKQKPFTPETIHWIASISKTFVGLALMKLVDQQKLALDQPINEILPYRIVNPYYPKKQITLRQLVTHTSSITDFFEPYYAGDADVALLEKADTLNYPSYLRPNINYYNMGKRITLDENIQNFTQPGGRWYSDSNFLRKEPGTHYQYSNLGASIAARIVEIKSGMSFVAFTKKYIFEPLKMNGTGWNFEDLDTSRLSKIYAPNAEVDPSGVVAHPQYYMTNYPVSGLKTTATDMGKYLVEMIRGVSGKAKLLTPASYRLLFAPQLPANMVNEAGPMGNTTNMGVFWFLSDGIASHVGGNNGVYSFIYINPLTKRGAFAHANLRDPGFGEILRIVRKYEPVLR
jgi:CubicO group peptidase (beta-lactamase class C family)